MRPRRATRGRPRGRRATPRTQRERAGPPAEIMEEEETPAAPATPATASARARARAEARSKALARLAERFGRDGEPRAKAITEALDKGFHPLFLGRYRREMTGGID